MSDTIYRKVGRRYVLVGYDWAGWPANGVWYVHDGRRNLMMRVGDMPDPMPLAALERHREVITAALREAQKPVTDRAGQLWTRSLADQVSAILIAVAKAEQEVAGG